MHDTRPWLDNAAKQQDHRRANIVGFEADRSIVCGLHLGCNVERSDDGTWASVGASELQVSSPDLITLVNGVPVWPETLG